MLEQYKLVQSHAINASTTPDVGADVDLAKYTNCMGRNIMAVATIIPTGADTDETVDVKIQQSSSTTDGDFADISGATFTQVTQESTAALEAITFRATKRYIRAYATIAGTTPGFALNTAFLLEERGSST